MFHVPEKFRLKHGQLKSDKSYGNNGCFLVRTLKHPSQLTVIASDGFGWEHVSVSLHHRTPSWEEMCFVKDLFWDKDDCVAQYHPIESDYVNNHEFALHLWRPINHELPTPPIEMV